MRQAMAMQILADNVSIGYDICRSANVPVPPPVIRATRPSTLYKEAALSDMVNSEWALRG